ncbi:coiled-coil domain-containing protein 117 [Protopterus annectens]|uniref:coiled-coil domain-containing protein 117 n=1 Tax=Protopterus annectens TaxID=7888 RepID=UPI001CF9F7AF|nr:coiled-coil domain-containing protein 117 [Protopterus annectens]
MRKRRRQSDEEAPCRKKRQSENVLETENEGLSCGYTWHPLMNQQAVGYLKNEGNFSPPEVNVTEASYAEVELPAEDRSNLTCTLPKCEDRAVLEDDDSKMDSRMSDQPVLIMSDVLKLGLSQKTNLEILSEKVVESMTRPCMELVLWKPLQTHFTEELKYVKLKQKTEEESIHAKPSVATEDFSSSIPCTLQNSVECTDEEMELDL